MEGLNNLVSSIPRGIVSPTSNFIISPNNLVNQLSLAKLEEERKYPETTEIDLKDKDAGDSKKLSFVVQYKAEKIKVERLFKEPSNEANEGFKPTKRRR